jgi:hypothetical protein
MLLRAPPRNRRAPYPGDSCLPPRKAAGKRGHSCPKTLSNPHAVLTMRGSPSRCAGDGGAPGRSRRPSGLKSCCFAKRAASVAAFFAGRMTSPMKVFVALNPGACDASGRGRGLKSSSYVIPGCPGRSGLVSRDAVRRPARLLRGKLDISNAYQGAAVIRTLRLTLRISQS